jgi:hypothetical protein
MSMTEDNGKLGIHIPAQAVKRLKFAALERDRSVKDLVIEALTAWWATQPEGQIGPLFPGEVARSAPQPSPVSAPPPPRPVAASFKTKPKPPLGFDVRKQLTAALLGTAGVIGVGSLGQRMIIYVNEVTPEMEVAVAAAFAVLSNPGIPRTLVKAEAAMFQDKIKDLP